MTDHAGEGTVSLTLAPLYANAGVKNSISGTIDLNFIVNGVWIAGLSQLSIGVTGDVFRFPLTDIRNANGLTIDEVHFENLFGGEETAPQIFTVRNDTTSQMDITLTPKASLTPLGTALETYLSTYLSLDGITYSSTLTLNIPANDSLDFYMYYAPSSQALPGEKQWEVSQRDVSLTDVVLKPSWFYALAINIVGGGSEQTDARCLVTVPYEDSQMQSDFKDLRFCLANGTELEYEQPYFIDGVESTFIVEVPTLPAAPSSVDVYAYSGNNLAVSAATTDGLEEYNWLDGTTDPWTLEWGWRSAVETGTVFGASHSYYRLEAWWASYQGWLSKPETVAYGVWQTKVKWKALSQSRVTFDFILNGSAYNSPRYSVTWNNTGANFGNALFSIDYNESPLDSVNVPVDLDEHVITVLRFPDGTFLVYLDDVKLLEATDTTLTASQEVWLKIWAEASNPENQQVVYFDYVNISSCDLHGTVTLGTWTQYLILECKGGILYRSREIQGLESEIRHGCRIGGVYYE